MNYNVEKNINKFCVYMNEKAKTIGMQNSTFYDPAGVYNDSTAEDIILCLLEASNTDIINSLWQQKNSVINVKGENERERNIKSYTLASDYSKQLRDYYNVICGKGGTLNIPKIYNQAVLVDAPNGKEKFACVVMGAEGDNDSHKNRFKAAKDALDIAYKVYCGESSNGEEYVCAASAKVCVKPANGEPVKVLYEKNPSRIIKPASMSKMLTALCVVELVDDLNQEVCITQEMIDTVPDLFYQYYFKVGDIVKLIDLMASMFLESSNLAAYVLACVAGKEI